MAAAGNQTAGFTPETVKEIVEKPAQPGPRIGSRGGSETGRSSRRGRAGQCRSGSARDAPGAAEHSQRAAQPVPTDAGLAGAAWRRPAWPSGRTSRSCARRSKPRCNTTACCSRIWKVPAGKKKKQATDQAMQQWGPKGPRDRTTGCRAGRSEEATPSRRACAPATIRRVWGCRRFRSTSRGQHPGRP